MASWSSCPWSFQFRVRGPTIAIFSREPVEAFCCGRTALGVEASLMSAPQLSRGWPFAFDSMAYDHD